jgi:Raf kinase inhibitor-like YbhB/YbcL family protein
VHNISRTWLLPLAFFAASSIAVTACSRDGRDMQLPTADQTESIALATTVPEQVVEPVQFAIMAPWTEGEAIDPLFTCEGDRLSPRFTVTGLPVEAPAWGFSIVDFTADDALHWGVANISPEITAVEAGVVPSGATQSLNRIAKVGYAAPCPKVGELHTYILMVYALSQQLELTEGVDAETMLTSLEAGALGVAATTFTVQR